MSILHRRAKVQAEQKANEQRNSEESGADGSGVRDRGPDPKAAQLIALQQQAAEIQKQIEAMQ